MTSRAHGEYSALSSEVQEFIGNGLLKCTFFSVAKPPHSAGSADALLGNVLEGCVVDHALPTCTEY